MFSDRILLPRGTLSESLRERSRSALEEGALLPIEVSVETLEDAGIRFVVRQAAALKRKEAARSSRGGRDPFLPYDPALLVAEVTDTHVALLNKFAVLEGHLLLVTRRYEDQEMLINADDWLALAACLREFEAFAFYNGGSGAGASQSHKHLQLVPVASLSAFPELYVPVETLFGPVRGRRGVCRLPGLPFRHAFAWLEKDSFEDLDAASRQLQSAYHELLGDAGLQGIPGAEGERQSEPYNLLLTRAWMMIVPRSRESYCGISVNGLGFAGSLFVPDSATMAAVRNTGPMNLLAGVALAIPRDPNPLARDAALE